MNSVPTWGFFILGVVSAAIAVVLGKGSSRLLQGKSIQEVVDRANSIIELYQNQAEGLETEVANLRTEIGELKKKLDETLSHNAKLQELLLKSPAQP